MEPSVCLATMKPLVSIVFRLTIWSITSKMSKYIYVFYRYSAQTNTIPTPSRQNWWALIRVNFDPIQEIEPKVEGGHSFKGGCTFTTLR